MFEIEFKKAVFKVTKDPGTVADLWSEIMRYYEEPGRYYHNLTHLDNLYADLVEIQNEITDWQTIIFSIGYHDIIYDPSRPDNEERSAELAFERLTQINLPQSERSKCKEQILATKKHLVSDDTDTNYFTDADLAILGADPATYKQYSIAIRNEYRIYPDQVYNAGRKKVLEHFISMPGIYKTAYFQNKYEKNARENLLMELGELSKQKMS